MHCIRQTDFAIIYHLNCVIQIYDNLLLFLILTEECLPDGICTKSLYITNIIGDDGQILLPDDEESGSTLNIHYDEIGVTGLTYEGKVGTINIFF